MRKWIPIFLLASALAAQTPDALQKLEQRLDSLSPQAQQPLIAPGPWVGSLPKASSPKVPRTSGGVIQRSAAAKLSVMRNTVTCAIPLLEAKISPGFQDKMGFAPPEIAVGSMLYVTPPAAACEKLAVRLP